MNLEQFKLKIVLFRQKLFQPFKLVRNEDKIEDII